VAEYKISSTNLDKIGFYKVARNFLMFPRKGWHFRLDQKAVNGKGDLRATLTDAQGKPTGAFGYIISSFHVKQDQSTSFVVDNKASAFDGKKIVDEESKYVYFAYAGGGVWQPIWGYQKRVQSHKGQTTWQADNSEIDSDTWAFACDKARCFTAELSRATGGDHGLANGPIQGAGARLFNQL
jgi:hypothetical protein